MTAFVLHVTSAGATAVVNAQNTGTAPVVITQAGLTETGFTADESIAAVPGEFARIATLAGDIVGDNIIHLVIRDEGASAYTLRGFGLYLSDGTLFAVCSPGVGETILEKSSDAMLLLAADFALVDLDVDAVSFGDTDFLNPPATTERKGVIEIATTAEAVAAARTDLAVAPSGIAHLAPKDSPALVGTPTAPTAAAGVNTDQLATTAFVAAALLALINGAPAPLNTLGELAAALGNDANFAATMAAQLALKAPLLSPTFTGLPRAPTPSPSDNSTLLATTAFVAAGLALRAPLESPNLTGIPTAPTAPAGNASTRIANTAFVQAAIATLVNSSPTTLDTLSELATALGNDPNFATTIATLLGLKAPLASPNFSGAPTAPSPARNDVSAKLATTAFVQDAMLGWNYSQVTLSDGPDVYTGTIPGLTALDSRIAVLAKFPTANNSNAKVNLNGLGDVPLLERDFVTKLRKNAVPRVCLMHYAPTAGAWIIDTPVTNGCFARDTNAAANTIDLAISDGAFQVYYDGQQVFWKVQTTNTGAVVINVNGGGPKALRYRQAAVAAGMLADTHVHGALFDAAADCFHLITPPSI